MLPKYRPVLDTFSSGVTRALSVRFHLNPWLPLYEALHVKGLGQADVVLELLRLSLLPEVEALIGHPIIRIAPRPPRPYPPLPRPEPTPYDRVIHFAVPNPRLPTTDSFHRFKELRPGVTLSKALRRGVTHRDIREALNNRWIVTEDMLCQM